MDLHRQFDTLAGPAAEPTADDVAADLGRGRRALRKRRTVQAAAGSAFTVAALAAGLAFAGGGTPATTTPTVAAGSAPGSASAPVTRLVAYQGAQPKGYTIDKVPDGWEVQNDDANALILAPKDALDKDPNSFVGKIGIFLQSKDQKDEPRGKKVAVGDVTGVLVPEQEPDDPTTKRLHEEARKAAIAKGGASAAPFLVDDTADDGATLWVKQPNDVYLLVQFWEGLGLSERDMLAIGAGVHVHEDAVQGVG